MEFVANIPDKGLGRVEIENGRIASVQNVGPPDGEKPFISPGLIDIQLNGFAGIDFCDAGLDPAKARNILPALWKTGVTTFCPTVITNTQEGLLQCFRALEAARRLDPRFDLCTPCYHLEGPYISPGGSRGAHNPKVMRRPDWNEFLEMQQAAGGRIGIVTLAPELPGALDFIRCAREAGVVVAMGHTDATPEQIHQGADAGAQLNTHLGNGCPQMIDRHRTPLWAQLAIRQLSASMICDGFHLPRDLVQVIHRAKGIDACVLITDAVHVAGLSPGRYKLVDLEIDLLPSGQVVAADRHSMAGSAVSMDRAVKVFMDYAEVNLGQAIQAATANPSRLLGRYETCGEVKEGQPANLVIFRVGGDKLEVEKTVLDGEVVYERAASSVAGQ
ncbi:MAG: N-acetylglucosamine-6-phosphate deacetylase [Acidobacteria bacterium]|nr:MAG: N-acetylglucosamine-6-phosphate deacetylase [Acidobacteriota bacterium]